MKKLGEKKLEKELKKLEKLSFTREELLKGVSRKTEFKLRDLINKDIKRRRIAVNNLIEEISIRITGLVEIDDDFDYKNLIEFKRNILEKKDIKRLNTFDKILTNEQKNLLKNYKKERYLSVIYGSPLYETKKEKIDLNIGEELYFISEKIKSIFN